MNSDGLLLDTCIVLFASNGERLTDQVKAKLRDAYQSKRIFVSVITALEIGQLASRGRTNLPVQPMDFFNALLAMPGLSLCELTPEVMINSSFLPNWRHRDPADRILVATARRFDLTLATSDRAILDYGAQGHVKTLAC